MYDKIVEYKIEKYKDKKPFVNETVESIRKLWILFEDLTKLNSKRAYILVFLLDLSMV